MNKPTIEEQKELLSINSDGKEVVEIPYSKKKFKVGWMKEITKEKLSLLELNSGIEATQEDTPKSVKLKSKYLAKASSLILLNGWMIIFFHWIYWRYLYYFKGYSANQLLPIVKVGKKKAVLVESYIATTLVAQMKVTNPMMTKEEVERFQAGLSSE